RKRRTASGVGASGVPRLTTRTPVRAGMAARYRKGGGPGTKARRKKKRPGGSLPAAIVKQRLLEGGANGGEEGRRGVDALVLGAPRPGLVEVEAPADVQRGVVAAVAEVGVARAAFELDAFRHPATQAEVQEVAVVVGVQAAAGVQADVEVADAA